MFHQDNAQPIQQESQKIEELSWGKIFYPPYSPDHVPLDYHLFCSLKNHLEKTTFVTQKDVETNICLRIKDRRILQ